MFFLSLFTRTLSCSCTLMPTLLTATAFKPGHLTESIADLCQIPCSSFGVFSSPDGRLWCVLTERNGIITSHRLVSCPLAVLMADVCKQKISIRVHISRSPMNRGWWMGRERGVNMRWQQCVSMLKAYVREDSRYGAGAACLHHSSEAVSNVLTTDANTYGI